MIDLTTWLWEWNVRVNGMLWVFFFSAVFSADCYILSHRRSTTVSLQTYPLDTKLPWQITCRGYCAESKTEMNPRCGVCLVTFVCHWLKIYLSCFLDKNILTSYVNSSYPLAEDNRARKDEYQHQNQSGTHSMNSETDHFRQNSPTNHLEEDNFERCVWNNGAVALFQVRTAINGLWIYPWDIFRWIKNKSWTSNVFAVHDKFITLCIMCWLSGFLSVSIQTIKLNISEENSG